MLARPLSKKILLGIIFCVYNYKFLAKNLMSRNKIMRLTNTSVYLIVFSTKLCMLFVIHNLTIWLQSLLSTKMDSVFPFDLYTQIM